MRVIISILALIVLASAANAKPYSCSPNWPHTRAPQWAVELENSQMSGDHGEPLITADDPTWQHAVCDPKKHTVDWSWDPEKEVEVSCMPHAPQGSAPRWAVDIAKKQWKGNDAPAANDPIWQHAICNKDKKTVVWHFPGADEDVK